MRKTSAKKMKCCLRDGHVVFAPRCFSCKATATHVSAKLNPAGYHDYQCAEHAVNDPGATWGSDPGWNTAYVSLSSLEGRRIWKLEQDQKRSELRAKGFTDDQIETAIKAAVKQVDAVGTA